jgi:hypothetical protein
MDGKLAYERYKNYDNIVGNTKERPKYWHKNCHPERSRRTQDN